MRNLKLKVFVTGKMDGIDEKENDSVAMHKEEVEDLDFLGLPPLSTSVEQEVLRILNLMTLNEKISYIGGYKSLAIPPIPRLNLPSIWASDATSGLRCFKGGTSFPAALAMAATWNENLIEEGAKALAREFRSKGVSILLGPGVNIQRVSTCGRNFEYMGEDPFLAGKMGASYIKGAQSQGVITTLKHFACNNSEYDRHKLNSVVDERALREIYLLPFEIGVKEGNTLGIMSSYNLINGSWASENRVLLKQILRDEWGFNGFVMSDWNSLYSTDKAIKNGLNIEMPSPKWLSPKRVKKCLKRGLISEKDLDLMIKPLLETLFNSKVLHRPQVEKSWSLRDKKTLSLASLIATEAITLCQNIKKILPLDPKRKQTILLLGPYCQKTEQGGGGSSYVNSPHSISYFEGIKDYPSNSLIKTISYTPQKYNEEEKNMIKEADYILFCGGFSHIEESECWDRPWNLTQNQDSKIKETAELNSNIIVTINSGGSVDMSLWKDLCPAIFYNYYLGENSGNALAPILFGEISPSGKLPFTVEKKEQKRLADSYYVLHPDKTSLGQIFLGQGSPHFRKPKDMPYKESLLVGYRDFDTLNKGVIFPFGHGLSYTQFSLTHEKISKISKDNMPLKVKVKAKLSNTGEKEGSEVVQLYIRALNPPVFRPFKELKAFKKMTLPAHKEESLEFILTERAFQYYCDKKHQWVLSPGEYEIQLSFSSRSVEKSLIIFL